MRKLFAVAMLFAASAALAAPVSLSFEKNAYYAAQAGWYDNYPCGMSPTYALAYSSEDYASCNSTSNEWTMDYYLYDQGNSTNSIGGSGTVGWEYDSQVKSNNFSFSLIASNLVYASTYRLVNDPQLYDYQLTPQVEQLYYWTEFVVTEEVLYMGSLTLTDGQLQNSACWPGGSYSGACYDEQLKYSFIGGNSYQQGSILGPGTYQYWHLGGFERISLFADPGQTLTASVQEDYAFTFTAVVPIPAAVWLFGSGLGLLGWFRRRQAA